MASIHQDDKKFEVHFDAGFEDHAVAAIAIRIRDIDNGVSIGSGVITKISTKANAEQIIQLIDEKCAELERDAGGKTES